LRCCVLIHRGGQKQSGDRLFHLYGRNVKFKANFGGIQK
jgi:hypothetical protein